MRELKETYALIGKASVIMVGVTLVDKVLALAKEMIVAHRFGVSSALDVFNIAFAFPSFIVLLFTGALVFAFVPFYLDWTVRLSPQQADAHALSLLCMAALFFSSLTAVAYVLAPVLFPLLGYAFGAEEKKLGIILERLLILLIALDGVSIILAALNQAQKRFFSLQAASVCINVTTIILLLLFHNRLGIFALGWGLVLGTFFKGLYMAAVLRRGGFKFFTTVRFDKRELAPFIGVALPLFAAELLANVDPFVDQVMASYLTSGSVSALRYAGRVRDLFISVIIIAISTALFPFISERAIHKDYEGLRHMFGRAVIFLGFLAFPVTCFLALFSEELVALLLQRGAFDSHATRITAETLCFYSVGLFFYAYTFINHAFFTALKDVKPLFYMGCLSIFLTIVFNLIFMLIFGVKGIALSATIKLSILSVVFIFLLRKRLNIADFSVILTNFRIITIASALMAGVGYFISNYLSASGVDKISYFLITSMAMGACYVLIIWLFRTEELESYVRYVGTIVRFQRPQC